MFGIWHDVVEIYDLVDNLMEYDERGDMPEIMPYENLACIQCDVVWDEVM